jgi:hypothetical protein
MWYVVFAPHQLVVSKAQLVRGLRCAPRFSMIDDCVVSLVNLVKMDKMANCKFTNLGLLTRGLATLWLIEIRLQVFRVYLLIHNRAVLR